MENGLMTKQDSKVQAFYIDQEVLECAQLNMRTKKRTEEMARLHKIEETKKRKAKNKRERFNAYTRKTFRSVIAQSVAVFLVARLGSMGMIHPFIWVPVSIIGLCALSVKVGLWIGVAKKR